MSAANDKVIAFPGCPAPRAYSKAAISLALVSLAMRGAGVVLAGIGAARVLGF